MSPQPAPPSAPSAPSAPAAQPSAQQSTEPAPLTNAQPEAVAAAAQMLAVGARRSLRQQLQDAGLRIEGPCERLSRWPQLMQRSDLLQDFSAAEADTLGRAMLLVRASPGQPLITQDESSDWMLLLLAGTVDVLKRHTGASPGSQAPNDFTRLGVVREGALLGEMSMLDGEPRNASCIALGEVQAAVIDRAAVAHLITEHPGVGAKLLVKLTQLLAQRLRNTTNQLVRALDGRPKG